MEEGSMQLKICQAQTRKGRILIQITDAKTGAVLFGSLPNRRCAADHRSANVTVEGRRVKHVIDESLAHMEGNDMKKPQFLDVDGLLRSLEVSK